jgi:peptidoglycan-associated lipoprotein
MDESARLRSMSVDELERLGLFEDVHFDFDRSDIRDDDMPTVARNADVLRLHDFLRVTIEGHCDARGTAEYNLALGERRAKSTYDHLVSLGIRADRLRTASYGKETPVCPESTEECWARNRRATLAITGKATERP